MRGRGYTAREIPWPPNRPSYLTGEQVVKLFGTGEFNKAWAAAQEDFKKLARDGVDPLEGYEDPKPE